LLQGIESGASEGVGIRGMRERLRELGGTLDILSDVGGTIVRASVPWNARVFAQKDGEENGTVAASSAPSAR
jgi:signal transduction histidine kinase